MNKEIASYNNVTEYWSLKQDQCYPLDEEVILKHPSMKDEILSKKEMLQKTLERLNDITIDELNISKQTLLHCIDSILKSINNLGVNEKPNSMDRSIFYNRITHSIVSSIRLGCGFDATFEYEPIAGGKHPMKYTFR